MIITKTPFRISFAGGGTDLPAFYQTETGAVISTAIDKHMLITVNKRFDSTIRISYSRTEIVPSVEEVQHPIVREAMRLTGLTAGIEITSIADLPAGTGMGSSSAFAVGLLNALHAYAGHCASAEQLAREACQIEIGILKEPIGKQDQYAAAYGGLNHIEFHPDETVFVHKILGGQSLRDELDQNLLLFYTGVTRSASELLAKQSQATANKMDVLRRMRDISHQMTQVLREARRLSQLGELLHEAWLLKRTVSSSISNPDIDLWYEQALGAGALGGKLLGAGGGGFLLFYVERQNHARVREALSCLKELPFRLDPQGSRIIYAGD